MGNENLAVRERTPNYRDVARAESIDMNFTILASTLLHLPLNIDSEALDHWTPDNEDIIRAGHDRESMRSDHHRPIHMTCFLSDEQLTPINHP